MCVSTDSALGAHWVGGSFGHPSPQHPHNTPSPQLKYARPGTSGAAVVPDVNRNQQAEVREARNQPKLKYACQATSRPGGQTPRRLSAEVHGGPGPATLKSPNLTVTSLPRTRS